MGHSDLSEICANRFRFHRRHTVATNRLLFSRLKLISLGRPRSFAFYRINTQSFGIPPLWRLSGGGKLLARKSDNTSAITKHILDKEIVQLKCFLDEPRMIRQCYPIRHSFSLLSLVFSPYFLLLFSLFFSPYPNKFLYFIFDHNRCKLIKGFFYQW